MKLRKLILHSKLKQIEKQNQNIIIYHCNLTAAEWRQFKNFLLGPEGSKSLKKTSGANEASRREAFDFDTSNPPLRGVGPLARSAGGQTYRVFFLSKSTPTFQASGPLVKNSNFMARSAKQKTIKPTGCLVFLENSSAFQDLHQSSSLRAFKIIKKLESSDLNKNLLLLYGQMNHLTLNHLDVKRALQLNAQETYQQFLFSFQALGNALNSFLYQNTNEFIRLQERRAEGLKRANGKAEAAFASALPVRLEKLKA